MTTSAPKPPHSFRQPFLPGPRPILFPLCVILTVALALSLTLSLPSPCLGATPLPPPPPTPTLNSTPLPGSPETPATPSTAQPRNFGEFKSQFRSMQWKVEQGLPQNHVTALLQTSDGYIWVGTVFGLARYDGSRFTVFERTTLPTMTITDDHVLDMAEDADGALWVCVKSGLYCRYKNVWTSWASSDTNTLNGLQPTSVIKARRGGVWIGAQGAILHFNRNGLISSHSTPQFPPPHNPVRSIRKIIEMPDSTLYCADRYRLMHFDPKTGTFEPLVWFADIDTGWLRFLFLDQKNRVLFGSFTIWEWANGKANPIGGITEGVKQTSNDELTNLRQDQNGIYWTSGMSGLRQYKDVDGKLVRTGEIPINQHEEPLELLTDREGNLWVGTMYAGLLFYQERQLKSLLPSNEPGGWNVWSVIEGSDNSLWIGTSQGLFHHDNQASKLIPRPPRPNTEGVSYLVQTLHRRSNGEIWTGISHAPLCVWNGFQWLIGNDIPALQHLADQPTNFHAFFEDSHQRLWCAHDLGILCIETNQVTLQFKYNSTTASARGSTGADQPKSTSTSASTTAFAPFPILRTQAIQEDPKGNIWVGGENGIARFQNGQWTHFGPKQGFDITQVDSLLFDSLTNLWVGTPSGLIYFDHKSPRIITITQDEGLFDNLVNYMVEDDLGYLWISCNRGIYRTSVRELNQFIQGTIKRITYMPFGEADGMLSSETNVNGQNAGCKTRDGSIFFPTTKGLIQIEAHRIKLNQQKPDPKIEQVVANAKRVFGESTRPLGSTNPIPADTLFRPYPSEQNPTTHIPHLHFPAGEARVIEIRYTASSFTDPTKVRFRYLLQGHDTDWQEAGERRITHYTNLDPKNYTFFIQACNNHGFWSDVVPGFTFEIAPFFYQTWTFRFGCTAILLILVGAIQSYRLGVQRQILQLEKDSALQTERSRIAKDMHDELGARLTQLGLISEMAEQPNFNPDRLRKGSLPKVSTLARDAVRSLDEIVWAVTPDKNHLNELAGYLTQAAQDLVAPQGLRLELQIPRDLPAIPVSGEVRHNIFLIAKEALNNAVKHAKASKIGLKLTSSGDLASLIISDDGCGFIPSSAEGLGNGMENMRRRTEMIHGRFSLHSVPEQGTSITIQFPTGNNPGLNDDPDTLT